MTIERTGAFLNVTSEIGKLNAVMLHKPGRELEGLTPDYLKDLLFDDIPWLKKMKVEHDEFANVLRSRGTTVYYTQDLLTDVLADENVKRSFVRDILVSSRIDNPDLLEELTAFLMSKPAAVVAEISIAGLNKKDVPVTTRNFGLGDYVNEEWPMYINPVPNLYFMRDPAATIGKGISINSMFTEARRREPMLIKYIYDFHPLLKKEISPLWYNHTYSNNIEGGDELILSKSSIAIGCSERTSSAAIETIARNLFAGNEDMKEVLAVQIPAVRAFMHLDTVFTMVDHDKFTVYPGILDRCKVYKLERGAKSGIKVSKEDSLKSSLERTLKIPAVNLIESGGGDHITAAREQWNDSTNTLAIAPGVVVTYARNEVSNEVLRKNGVEVLEIDGSELVRGRGGPRCMSMPLNRDAL